MRRSVLRRNVKKTKREWWKRRGGGHFTAAAANGFSGLMRISSRGSAAEREERASSCSAPAKHTRAPRIKNLFFYFLRMPRRLIAGAHLSQPFSNYRETYRARNKRENGTIDASARGRCRRKGLSAAIRRIAPAAGGVMQKAAHRCNAACIKQLLCGFCSRSTQH